ncbi:MAG: hypothetical protein HUK40_01075 [Desulfobacter sp.]|nr:hypothetical protein [Desulfobacter sp.]WDP85589.1 MAG: hypothetical protein HUN05_10990 [Desulfobacter sp.]
MKDRAVRQHEELKVRRKLNKQYNSCIEGLSSDARHTVEGNAEKLKKVCASPYSEDHDRKMGKKTIQELKHDITMREQLG